MSQDVVAGHADQTVEQAEELMQARQVRRLPVLDSDNRPVGVVSMSDLARLAARARKSGVDREVVHTLAAVSQPRARAASVAGAATVTRPALAG
jgi:CBS domain-containing protein